MYELRIVPIRPFCPDRDSNIQDTEHDPIDKERRFLIKQNENKKKF